MKQLRQQQIRDVVRYAVTARAPAAGSTLRDLALPDGAVVAMVLRGGEMIAPDGETEIRAGDHVTVVLRPDARAAVDRAFADGDGDGDGDGDPETGDGDASVTRGGE